MNYVDDSELQKKFEEFHKENPDVYRELLRLCWQAKAANRKKLGMRMLIEVVRWNRLIQTKDPNFNFKINNDYSPRYARKIMDEFPEMTGMFELRTLTR